MKSKFVSSQSIRRSASLLCWFNLATFTFGLVGALFAEDASPFKVAPSIVPGRGAPQLSVAFQVPKDHHLYADELSFEIAGKPAPFTLPKPTLVQDKFSQASRGMYATDFAATLPFPQAGEFQLTVNLRGCSQAECYFPETRKWTVRADQTVTRLDEEAPATPSTTTANGFVTGFEVSRRASGYLNKDEFLRFLKPNDKSPASDGNLFAGLGVLATLGLILLGGLALNLTPCVLPMIPINLAILGAGAKNGNQRRGFALGGAYGGGMALAYGGLGLVVVLTGSKFGTLNSSAWFNFGIAAVFCVMALAMFDKLNVDLSRFQRMGGPQQRSGAGAFVGASLMGGFSALLAGACVAPVVISVLLLATTSYQQGNWLGLLFPFVLGLGMALPWPFAAAGLSFLPKPGMWMTRVKYAFGVIILIFAAWYGWLGFNLTSLSPAKAAAMPSNSTKELRAALAAARQSGQPVVVDFWASWCKNCEAMEHTTFRDEAVRQNLKSFVVVKFQAEHLNDADVKPLLDEFGVLGLPSYVLLRPLADATAAAASAPSVAVR